MSDLNEKSIRILTFSGKKEDWTMWSDKFLAKASMKGYDVILDGSIIIKDDDPSTLSTTQKEAQEEAKKLNKRAYNELILACTDKISFGIVKGAKTKLLPKGDAKEAWNRLKVRFEPNTGTELLTLNKSYMSLELSDVKEDPEEFITRLDELRARMAEEPFNEVITDKSFMLHVLNSLPIEYESAVEAMERELAADILTIDELKEQVRSKYQRLLKKLNIKDDELALMANNDNKKKFKNYKQGFKGTCRICGKYGHKAADCWENEKNKNKNGDRNKYQFKGKCNYCGIYGHKERECRKKKAAENQENNGANIAEEGEDTVLISHTHQEQEDETNVFPEHIRQKLMLEKYEGLALACWEVEPEKPNKKRKTNEDIIDLQSEEIQKQIAIDDARIYEEEMIDDDSSTESGTYFASKEYEEWIINNPEYQRQITKRTIHQAPSCGDENKSIRMNNNQDTQTKISFEMKQNVEEESDDGITWGTPEDTDLSQIRREEETIFGIENQEEETALISSTDHENESIKPKIKKANYDVLEMDTWICDTGASTHMCNSDEGMFDCIKCTNQFIKVGSGQKLEINKKGKKRCVAIQKDGTKKKIILENVYHIPKLWYNLFSVLESLRKGWKITNDGLKIEIKKRRNIITFDRVIKCPTGHLTGVKLIPENDTSLLATHERMTKIKYIDAHAKLFHANDEVVKNTGEQLNWKIDIDEKEPCIACALGKAKQMKIKKETNNKALRAGERLFIDISSVNHRSLGGSEYMVLIVDDYTKYQWCKFLKKKSEMASETIEVIKKLMLENHEVKKIRCDNAGENLTLEKLCLKEGFNIEFEFTAPYSPQYNGKVERSFPTIFSKMRSSFAYAGIPEEKGASLWSECASTIVHVENIIIKNKGEKCAYEKLKKKMPAYIKDLRTFGEMAVVKDNGSKIKGKLKNRGVVAMFVGYSDKHASKVYRFLKLDTNRIIMSRDVTWLNKMYGDYNKKNEENELEIEIDVDEETDKFKKDSDEIKVPREVRNLQTSYNDAEKIFRDESNKEFVGFAFASEKVEDYPEEPQSFQEAWHHPNLTDREGWRNAIRKEFSDMIKRGVWRRIKKREVPPNRRTIGSKWVFKRKRDGRYRARLCGLGYTQVAGIDFTANFAPVVNDVTFRILLVCKMMKNWDAEVIDIETAFLHGDMEELIFMDLPEGLNIFEGVEENDNDDCVILDKCIYGTVQSARQWAKKFKQTLKKIDFEVSLLDPCLMIRKSKEGTVILCIYVDDVLMMGDKEAINKAIEDIMKEFSIRKEGKLHDYLGCIINFDEDNDTGTIHQPYTLQKLENKFNKLVKNIRKTELPSAPGSMLKRPTELDVKIDEKLQNLYRSGVGILLYLTKYTRPDISNAVREHSKMMDGATMEQYRSLLRLIKFVIDTKNQMLKMKVQRRDGIFSITGYSDADYAGDKDTRRSISGLIIYLCGIPITWRSKGQKAVTLSSTESEYYALSELCSEIIFVKQILEFLEVEVEYPIIVRVDNVGAMFLANNPVLSQRTKHISVRQHFIREFVEDGIIKVIFVKSKNNDADIFTKNLSKELFEKHKKRIISGEDDDDEK